MNTIRVGAAALNQTPLDWDANASTIRQAIHEARDNNVSLLCLPELSICGYGCEDAFFAASTRRMSRKVLQEILPETRGIAVTLGLPVFHKGALYNACVFVVDCAIVGIVPKQHLAGDGLHYEHRWFTPWPKGEVINLTLDGITVPFGDLIFDFNGIRVGFEICEDAWVAQRPGVQLADRGVDVILNPSASHFAFEKHSVRRGLVSEASRAFGVAYVYSNLVGNEAGRAIYDGDTMIAAGGPIVAQGLRFGYRPCVLTHATVDIEAIREQRAQRTHAVEADEALIGLIKLKSTLQTVEATPETVDMPAWEASDCLEEEEFARALPLALFDYARKSRSKGFIVSLSGGADSTAVACLVRLMVDFAVKDLGAERVCSVLSLNAVTTEDEICNQLLTTAYQSTRNSSQTTRDAARDVAEAVGARHLELDVDGLTNQYIDMIEQGIGRTLSWETDDIALQNIQARVRAPGVWMLANIEQKLLLATSNRSEAAVGYATMDGDTCGSISPIAGIDKAFLRSWLVWLEQQGPEGLGPIKAVGSVNRLAPTAELRPQEQKQTDEDDLMPYDVLDAIEHEAIGLKHSPAEALVQLQKQFPQHEASLNLWVNRFYTLWCRNQWKRERYAPSFHIDDKNLDPKTWCRFPILSGGFRRELRELNENDDT